MPRSTHAAQLTSLARYGLVAYGSGAYEVNLGRLETLRANVSARRITGISRSARSPTLHMTAGVTSVRNLHVQTCALLLGRGLRARNGAHRQHLT